MEEMKQFSAIIPLEEYERLKSLRADKALLKEELKNELLKELSKECGTHYHNYNTYHSYKGLGIFGGFLAVGGILTTQIFIHVEWYWMILPIIAICYLMGMIME